METTRRTSSLESEGLLDNGQMAPFYSSKVSQTGEMARKASQKHENEAASQNELFALAKEGDYERVKEIISKSNEMVNQVDDVKRSTLHYASSYGHFSVAWWLIENGAQVDCKDKWGETPLHRASQYNHVSIISLLLQHGANMDEKNKEGNTPLHHAVFYGKMEAVEYLHFMGADWSLTNGSGRNVIAHAETSQYVSKMRHLESLRFLEQHPNQARSRLWKCCDGHEVVNQLEQRLDDWLYQHGLSHCYQPEILGNGNQEQISFYIPIGDIYLWLTKGKEDELLLENYLETCEIQIIEITAADLLPTSIDQQLNGKLGAAHPLLYEILQSNSKLQEKNSKKRKHQN